MRVLVMGEAGLGRSKLVWNVCIQGLVADLMGYRSYGIMKELIEKYPLKGQEQEDVH